MERHLPRDGKAVRVLDLIRELPRSGQELAYALNLTPAELALLTYPLWHAKLLQGDAADGFCQRPNGRGCVSCRLDRRWRVSGNAAPQPQN